MKRYNPRPYARSISEFLARCPRANLWATPGAGKTVTTLTHIQNAHTVLGDTRPTLVVAPLRVARDVWTDEAAKWEHLQGLRVASAVGGSRERAAAVDALRAGAVDVLCINYESLPTLLAAVPAGAFGRVVADECTRLKSFRLRSGSMRAKALAAIAHGGSVTEWVNLTGTPAPNGSLDLWGQQWFIDRGARLGRSYRAFEDENTVWTRVPGKKGGPPGREGMVQSMREGADERVRAALADCTLTVDPSADLPDALHSRIDVRMPPRAAVQYKQMEREMRAALADGTHVDAVSAGAVATKCLQIASGTVITGEGGSWQALHDAKLEALEELSEELGEPLLVAYHFRADYARLRERFPDALDMADQEHMARAKAGEGRIWLAHPASVGHGVDGLQHHCRAVCFFGHWFSAENRLQLIERVGPMRQAQAGTGRNTLVYDIVTLDTVDEVAVARVASKVSLQQALLEHMK